MMRKSNILFHFNSKYWTSQFIVYLAYLKQLSFGEGQICMGAWQCVKVSTNRLMLMAVVSSLKEKIFVSPLKPLFPLVYMSGDRLNCLGSSVK